MIDSLVIAPRVFNALCEHARSDLGSEVCGIVSGYPALKGFTREFYPIDNASTSPQMIYEMEPTQLLNVLLRIEAAGLIVGAIFHTHPKGMAFPSHIDVMNAFYEDTPYIIAAPHAREGIPEMRAFILSRETMSCIEIPMMISTGLQD